MVEKGIDFFFDMLKWSFDFLIDVKLLGISVLYYFLAILLLGVVIGGLINTSTAGNVISSASNSNKRRQDKEYRDRRLKRAGIK